MLVALGVSLYIVVDALDIQNGSLWNYIFNNERSKIFFFDDFKSNNHFIKQFISGIFIAVVMTGLDQDMMQKNLTCRSLKDAQKNMFWFTIVLTIVNFIFLCLGLLLTEYAISFNIDAHKDQLFPTIAMEGRLGITIAFFFILGLIAAAYSSADSALTSLTTSFSVDILKIEQKYERDKQIIIRKKIHILFSFIIILVIISFKYIIADESVIAKLFKFAGFTYGPLLGLYAFGLFTKVPLKDKLTPFVCIASVILSIIINISPQLYVYLSTDVPWSHTAKIAKESYYQIGFEILIINGALTFLGLLLIRDRK